MSSTDCESAAVKHQTPAPVASRVPAALLADLALIPDPVFAAAVAEEAPGYGRGARCGYARRCWRPRGPCRRSSGGYACRFSAGAPTILCHPCTGLLLMQVCSQMLVSPQSLHWLLMRLCSQMLRMAAGHPRSPCAPTVLAPARGAGECIRVPVRTCVYVLTYKCVLRGHTLYGVPASVNYIFADAGTQRQLNFVLLKVNCRRQTEGGRRSEVPPGKNE